MEERIIKDINNLLAQLFQKMYEAGYTWDAEKKELKKIGQKKEDASELTEFEAELFSMMSDAWQGYLRGEEVNIAEIVKEHSSELLERANEQKPAWSEEDEYYLNSCITKIEIDIQNWGSYGKTMIDDDKEIISWLKSLKERVQPKQEWSEEDEKQIRQIERIVKDAGCAKTLQEKISNWLKSIKGRVQLQNK